MTRLNSALGGMPEFPIEVHIAEDPAWAVYENFTADRAGFTRRVRVRLYPSRVRRPACRR